MSLKGVLKKKLKIKNPIMKMKKKKQKQKLVSDTPADTYTKLFDADNIQTNVTSSDTPLKSGDYQDTNTNTNVIKETTKKIGKKRKSSDNDASNECETPQKKKVTFAADVKSEKDDQKCTAGKMKPISLNKKKKLNYIKKLKAKKKKQKNIRKCEEEAAASRIPRQERAIEYLMQWKNDRSNWKFKKIYQLWLIKNTYDLTKISEEDFEILVEYLQTIEGKSRSTILQSANTIVTESSSNEDGQGLNSSQENKYQRARTIIQLFS